jgi:hypothetical protein
MSSGPERDMIDYIDDNTHHEDETLFIPVPDGKPDNWSVFYLGILTGLVGAGLLPLAPWLAGVLIFVGSAVTAFTLKARSNRFARALRFGFVCSAAFGAAIVTAEVLFPREMWHAVKMGSERSLIFGSAAAMPWAICLLRYLYALARNEKRLGKPVMRKSSKAVLGKGARV